MLQLLSSYNNKLSNPHHVSASSAAAPGTNGESCVVEANGGGAGEYLRQAASEPPTPSPIQLEVVDRKANPPTPDQLRSIIDYLASDTTAPSSSTDAAPKYTTSGFDLNQHNRRKQALAPHLSSAGNNGDADGGMPKIKDGPLVVNWDEGTAATSLEGVKQMLKRLEDQAATDGTGKSERGGTSCIVC